MAGKTSPNQFDLRGEGITISYSTSSIGGKAQLNFQKGKQNLNFSGDQITVDNTEIGTLVTVTIATAEDQGSTSFSFLLPELTGALGTKKTFRTIGITTVHLTTIAGPVKGAQETYKATQLRGTAKTVEFLAVQTAGR